MAERKRLPVACSSRVGVEQERRPANALNIEYMTPALRCVMKLPEHWSSKAPSALRWLASGGSPLVFGRCGGSCPRYEDFDEDGNPIEPSRACSSP